MSKIFIGIAVLFASLMLINATQFETLAQIDEHPFGNNLLNLVQMNLNMQQVDSASTMQQISDLLQEILLSLQSDQSSADSAHASSSVYFDTTIADDIAQRDNFQALLDQANADLVDLNNQLDDLMSQQATAQANYNEVTGQIATENQQNDAASAQFDIDQSNLQEAIDACSQAITKLSTLQSSTTAFVQISSSMEVTKKALEKQVAKNYPEFIPLLDILSQIKSNANPELVAQAINLIQKLKAALEQDLVDRQTAETNRVNTYNDLIATLTAEQELYQGQLSDLIVSIPTLQNEIQNKNDSIAFYDEAVSLAQTKLENDQQAAADEASAYNQTSAERQSEIDIVNRLIDHFNNQIANVSDFLKNRVQ